MAATRTTAENAQREADSGSLRLCAVSRTQKPPEELIRFVLGPDGSMVPDLARRLPGRGVWVTAEREAVAAAVRLKVFAKSVKQKVAVPDDLPGLVERLLTRRLADAVSLANKAGLVVAGFAKVEELLDERRVAVLLQAADAAADGSGKLHRKFKALVGADEATRSTVGELTSGELSLAIGRPNVVHAAASAGGACQRILQEAVRLRRYRAGGSASPAASCQSE